VQGRFAILRAALVAALLVVAGSPIGADERVVNVRALGAKGDGQTDDTGAFLKAIAQGKTTGKHVYVPRGTYVISKPLTLENIAVSGPAAGAWPADIDALPAILPTHRDGPAFHLLAGGGLSGIDITYRWKSEPASGPPAVLIGGIGVYVRNVRLRYPWDGILTDGEHIEAFGDAIRLGKEVRAAAVHGNVIDPHGNDAILNDADAKESVQIGANAIADSERPKAEEQ